MYPEWPAELAEELKRLWAEGLSASKIAARIPGTTRSSVIGKASRLKLARRASTPGQAAKLGAGTSRQKRKRDFKFGGGTHPAPSKAAGASSLHPSEDGPSHPIIPERIPFLKLKPWHCRWPLWPEQTDEHLFCGLPTTHDCPYCPTHRLLAFNFQAPSRRNKARAA